jgi:hypothetical protein
VKDFFFHGVDCELLRRALVVKEVAGPLSDLIQLLLGAIFSLQEEETEEYNDTGLSRIITTNGMQLILFIFRWFQFVFFVFRHERGN